MGLILKDRSFVIERATVSATIPDPYWSRKYNPGGDPRLFWCLDVKAKPEDHDGEILEVLVYHENLHFPIRRWTEVAGQLVEWSAPYDEDSGEPNGGFYVFEHAAIHRARLRFGERDGVRFRFGWEGVCDVFWDEEHWQEVPFAASDWADFTGVTVRASESDTPESMRHRLAQYLDVRDFVQGPFIRGRHCYEDGVGMADTLFTPVES